MQRLRTDKDIFILAECDFVERVGVQPEGDWWWWCLDDRFDTRFGRDASRKEP
jgi:hypothetical protein